MRLKLFEAWSSGKGIEDMNYIVDLSLAYVRDYNIIEVSKSKLGNKEEYIIVSIKPIGADYLCINYTPGMKDSILTFFQLIESKKYKILNIITYDSNGAEYALFNDDDSYKYENVYNDVDIMFDAIDSLSLDNIYIMIN